MDWMKIKLYFDSKPTLEWDDDTEMAPTVFGHYMVEWNGELNGYEAVLWNDNPIWWSELVESNNDDQFDWKAITECRRLAQLDYEHRTSQRFKSIQLPTYNSSQHPSDYDQGFRDAIEMIQSSIIEVERGSDEN
jgi:hypothetical protein